MFIKPWNLFLLVTGVVFQGTKGSVFNSYVCEHSTFHIECGAGQTITIVSALYGRQTSSLCTHGPINTDNCAAPSSLAVVRDRCNGRQKCDVSASNGVFGDPCGGTYKYLEIQYSCGGIIPGYVCEGGTFHLACDAGESISITSAIYGRQISSICTQGPIQTVHCAASNSLHTVRQQCNGRRTCSVSATNGVFGDPCSGTYKYLEIQYSCV